MYERYGIHFIHASDEWYILAEEELPEEDRYDGYLQLENGVGMLRLLGTNEVRQSSCGHEMEMTGELYGHPLRQEGLQLHYIAGCMDVIREKYPNITVRGLLQSKMISLERRSLFPDLLPGRI